MRTPFVVMGHGRVHLGRIRKLLGVADRSLGGVGDQLGALPAFRGTPSEVKGIGPGGVGSACLLLVYRLPVLGGRYTRFGNAAML
ncbi:hypothetical protein [Parapedobacter sp. 10938]|uniref:hypothetical protein n=1 Tax=Parapedobacter flavus TaxID=3110225 RepID=UPI002DBC5A2E|nr:hypothetical protein [Parapedobacter sp. 10938]MEC3881107.1 hypothetical protein [Parapedobacter sp. 10938]